jgi:hypothetical protein
MLKLAVLLAALAIAAPAHAQMIGGWSGVGLQVDDAGAQSTWTVELRVRADITSPIVYRSLGCRGTLEEDSRTATSVEYTERITDGPNRCISGGKVHVRLIGDRLLYYWRSPDGDAHASAVLASDDKATRTP